MVEGIIKFGNTIIGEYVSLNFKTRGFEVISKYADREITIPTRKTSLSAGYDISSAEDVTIEVGKLVLVPTGLKAYMLTNEYLGVHIRSSIAINLGLIMINSEGIIDADYYNNEKNEGHIMIPLYNIGTDPVNIKAGERIAQGIFYKYLTVDKDNATGTRIGGIGSTGK